MPPEINFFLNEYKEIVEKYILDGLLLLRNIIHCMDLIPRAIFLNKVPYRLTSTENEELNKEVKKLLQKGLIREILSPCVVPSVLSPKKNYE